MGSLPAAAVLLTVTSLDPHANCVTLRELGADEALQIGLVHEVVDDHELTARARALAEELAALPSDALQLTKRAAYESWNGEVHRALELAATYQGIAQNHPDHAERLGS